MIYYIIVALEVVAFPLIIIGYKKIIEHMSNKHMEEIKKIYNDINISD